MLTATRHVGVTDYCGRTAIGSPRASRRTLAMIAGIGDGTDCGSRIVEPTRLNIRSGRRPQGGRRQLVRRRARRPARRLRASTTAPLRGRCDALLLHAVDQPVVADNVRTELEPFLLDHGFQQADVNEHSIAYESAVTRVAVFWDPRGEIDVTVSRIAESSVHARWDYGEITTVAAVPWHLRRVIDKLSQEPGLLAGDVAVFGDLRQRNEQRSKELTAYYSRQGPRPKWLGRERG